MEARKCDRCKEYYDLTKEEQKERNLPTDLKGQYVKIYMRGSLNEDRGNWYDLCPKCFNKLKKWLKGDALCKKRNCVNCDEFGWITDYTDENLGYFTCNVFNRKVKKYKCSDSSSTINPDLFINSDIVFREKKEEE